MQAREIVDVIKQTVLDVKAQQQKVISVDAMANYLDALKRDIEGAEAANQKKFEADIAVFRAEHERNLARYEAQQTHAVELFRSVIAYGQAALKSAIVNKRWRGSSTIGLHWKYLGKRGSSRSRKFLN